MDRIEKELYKQLKKEGYAFEGTAFEMSTIQPKRSKLPYKVWLDDLGEKREVGHNPYRLKYGPHPDDFITIPFFEKQEIYPCIGKLKKGKLDMKPISKWINLNYDNLIKFYNQDEDYDIYDFIFDMKSI
ncbi:MAG: hypothetical protein K2H20_02940 [Bacilli bacterium]|nr:hypothetical protein [Bacilli bacterium]